MCTWHIQDEDDEYAQTLTNALSEAISNNNVEQVRTCISQGVDLSLDNIYHPFKNDRNGMDICPLAKACCLGHKEVMEELLKAGADPNQVSGDYTPVMLMPEETIPLSMLRCLIYYGADVNVTDVCGATALHYLSERNDENMIPVAKCLLHNGASLSARDHRLSTPLYKACIFGNADLVKLFIAEGADVSVDSGRETLLTEAAASANVHLFDVLLNAGADRHLTAKALKTACRANDYAMITKILDSCHLDINMPFEDRSGMTSTILQYACDNPAIRSGTVHILLDRGADAKAVTVTGDTVMHYAVKFADCSKIRQLLSYNPHLNVKNDANQTILVKPITSLHGQWDDSQNRWFLAWTRATVLAFKMLVTAGAQVTADVKRELHQLHSKCPETISDYEISSRLSLKAMCRLIVRQSIPVPVNASLSKLPLPKLLQEYLNFPEFNLLVDEYLNIFTFDISSPIAKRS